VPFGQDKPGMSHSTDRLIGATTHHGPQLEPPPMYGTPQYPLAYGATSYPPIPTNFGTPSTSSYSTSESTMPSYVPYGLIPPQNPYFPFPSPPQPIAPPHPHAGVNFVQPSVVQQYQNFEQLNTANPTHPSNNAKNKRQNRNNNNLGQGTNQPPQHQPTGGNQNQRNQNPQGGNNNKRQGRNKNNVKTIFPCSLCGEFGHYTHHFPQITYFKWLKDSGSLPHSLAPLAPQQAPQQYIKQPPPVVIQNPI
jgi:hypothetical protein